MQRLIHPLGFFFFFLFVKNLSVNAQINFTYQSSWKYLKGKDAGSVSASWMNPSYNDNSWLSGKAPFRYGDGAYGTELTDMQNSYSAVYMRSSFSCLNRSMIQQVSIMADYDDGFVLWINGTEVLRRNAPTALTSTSFAPLNHESGTEEMIILDASDMNIQEGINSIAVQGFNVNLPSSDFYFDVTFEAETDIPHFIDSTGVIFSVNSGFFDNPFYVTLSTADPLMEIVYTLDGSNPVNSVRSFTALSPVSVLVDPADTTGRPLTPSVIIRASVTKPGFKPSVPVSATYIFTEKLKTQAWPGGSWPKTDINGQIIDLGIDSRVINDPAYKESVTSSFLAIPSVSVITDNKNLFDPATGIYVNADGHGLNWERECSVELIYPDGSQGFKINAGLRIRGGWSRHDNFPKHAFRLFFREKYGAGKLVYPLFGDEGTNEFDKIDLRCEQNYAWSNAYSNNSLVRDVFSRDTQRDMGQPYSRSRYYHLYLNGMYWGIYQSQERPEARFSASYFGGNVEDYDVVKVSMDNYSYQIEATDGNLDSWQKIYSLCQAGFSSMSNYYKLQGKGTDGKPIKGGDILVDVDNLIDYMLLIFYTGNFDAPSSSFFKNKHANNFYAIDDRTDKSSGFRFFAHDSEHSMFSDPHSPGIGIYEDRVNIGTRTDSLKMTITSFSDFNPQWLHFKLTENAEYRRRFADRAYNQFKKGGVFSPEMALIRLNKRINEVSNAIISESARWGDAKRLTGNPYTKNGNWLPEVNSLKTNFIPVRPAIVINQLKGAGLYSAISAPIISTSSGPIESGIFNVTTPVQVRITNSTGSGVICYTLNGLDPRREGGTTNTGSVTSNGEVVISVFEPTLIKARVFNNGDWSGISEVKFMKENLSFNSLKITELHYHPEDYIIGSDTTDGKDLEFIEFRNTGNKAINFSGLKLDSAVTYIFPDETLLPPGQFYVVAAKPSRFWDYYGMLPSGNFSGNLSNTGEEILLKNKDGNSVIDFTYEDTYPWPEEPDGMGFSLSSELNNPIGDPGDYRYWKSSDMKGGTPFDLNFRAENENLTSSDSVSVYPNPTNGIIRTEIKTTDVGENFEITLYDMHGNRLYSMIAGSGAEINLKKIGLVPGTYILSIRTGYSIIRKRIILIN